MAQTLESLSRQNDTLTSIRGIVGTMKTLSAINAAPYEQAARSIEAYHQAILKGFAAFAHRAGEMTLHPEDAAEHWIVVFGSDHGLCGNYNESVAQLVNQHCQAQALRKPHLLARRIQPVVATLGCWPDFRYSFKTSIGVFQPSVFRGLVFSA